MEPEALYRALRASGGLRALCPPAKPLPLQGHFSTVLQVALARLDAGDPKVREHFAHTTEEFATLFDGYPKSQVHLLVMPRRRIKSARDLTPEQLPMVRRLAAYTTWLLEQLSALRPSLTWRHGVHANPSLLQVHVHVLSQDFQSPCLRNKKHYNSFQPPFLIGLASLISELETCGNAMGAVTVAEAEAWLKRDLRCSACGAEFGSRFADLKRHLESCRPAASAPLPWNSPEELRAAPLPGVPGSAPEALEPPRGNAAVGDVAGAAVGDAAEERAAWGAAGKRQRLEVQEVIDLSED